MDKLLLFIAAYLPFQLAVNPAAGIDLASIRIFILVFFFAWLAQGLKSKNISIRRNKITLFIVSFLFLSLLSALIANNFDWSLRKLLFLFSIFPIYFVASAIIDTKEKIEKLAQFLVLSGSLAALLGVIQFFSQFFFGLERVYAFWADYVIVPFLGNSFSEAVLQNPSWLVNIGGKTYLRATSTFPDPHMLSFYLGMLMPLALGLAISEKKKFIFSGALFALVLANLLTFSRGGYLGLVAGALFLLTMFWHRLEKRGRKAIFSALGAIILILAVPSPFSQRFYSSFNLEEGSNMGRLETWQKAIRVISSNPLFGVGIGNYPLEIKPTAGYREPIYAHNTYLDIAADSGVFASLAWIGALVASFLHFFRKRKEHLLFLASAASVLVFAVHSLVETGLYSVTVLPLLLIIMSFNSTEEKK